MSGIERICLIGYGEVGRILGRDLAKSGVHDLRAYDLLFDSDDSATVEAPVRPCRSADEAADGAELVISAVTAAQDHAAALSVVSAIGSGAFYLDLNSCSPGQKQASAATIEAAGGRYVEGAVMTPFPPKGIASAMLLGGPHGEAFLQGAGALGFAGAEVFSQSIGQASAVKMCRSVMIKGIEALVMESMLAARRSGIEDKVLASLSDLLPVGDWPALARYMISRSIEHGVRRAEEMEESARTVAEAGVQPLMTQAIVARQAWAADHREALTAADLGGLLDKVLADIDAATAATASGRQEANG